MVDINPGPANSEPEAFAAIGDGKVVFSAANTTSGRELWITDGTVAGTSLLRDIRLGAGDSSPGSFATVLLNSAPALVAPLPHAPLLQSFEKLVAGVVEKGNVENESRELEVKSDQLAARYPTCLPACA